ncbi:asparaginase [Emydomyces testavorans]|uniref:Asparaginase n=1 Tax=Emydomyces testavorans TaxID=2070801 RepID=A0AAF0DH40_9EURO|nr:asparaginase [Emydomyces testavorans]
MTHGSAHPPPTKGQSHRPKPLFKPAVILHGGAGNIERSRIPPELYEQYRTSLLTYLRSTYALLNGTHGGSAQTSGLDGRNKSSEKGCSALDAAVHAVSLIEDDPLFNCGRGSVFTTAGTIEMEASVMVCSVVPPSSSSSEDCNDDDDASNQSPKEMDTAKIKRGAGVMMVNNVRHPIQLAREVLLRTGYGEGDGKGGSMHSQLCGPHVEKLAKDWGLEFKPDEWFWTKRRWDEHQRGLRGPKVEATIDHDAEQDLTARTDSVDIACDGDKYLSQGTVGAVCLDRWGNIAVATSTGGLTNKFPGRIGDTPTLGAGFWAEDCDLHKRDDDHGRPHRRAMAVSGTGNGDSFLRTAAARTVGAMARLSPLHVSLADAVTAVCGPGGELQRSAGDRWGKTGEGTGGMIGIEVEWDGHRVDNHDGDKIVKGKVTFDFNGGGMFRAWIEEGPDGEDRERMMVFRDEY